MEGGKKRRERGERGRKVRNMKKVIVNFSIQNNMKM